jgi:hypothetical protein
MFAKKSSSLSALSSSQQQLNMDFLVWLALDLEPFTMVTNRGLSYFFRKNFPQISIPDESTLRKSYLKNVYDLVADKVKLDIAAVKSMTLMFDGWTDKHHAVHYLGIRAQFITDEWVGKVVTISVKPCRGDSDSIVDHIQKELDFFIPNRSEKQLFSTHDGASAMKKVSRLLKVTDFTHCVAHALHLLLTTDSMARVTPVLALLRKCKEIVNVLHFKAEILENEVLATNDVIALTDLLDKIGDIKAVLSADDQFTVPDEDNHDDAEDMDLGENDCETEAAGESSVAKPKEKMKMVHRLQNDVPTRWNSSLQMITSLLHIRSEVSNALKQTGHYSIILKAHEWSLLEELRDFLQCFAAMTDLVSCRITSLALIALVRAEIADACKINMNDSDELKTLKKLITSNMDKRLPLSDVVKLSTLFDPSTKKPSYAER